MPLWNIFNTITSSPLTTAATTATTITASTTSITQPVWYMDQGTGSIWSTWAVTSGSGTYSTAAVDPWAQQAYLAQRQHAQYAADRYAFEMQRPSLGLGSLFPSAPAIIRQRQEEQDRRDREAYTRALAEHDEQEAARIMRQIEAREASAAEQRRQFEEQQQRERDRQRQGDMAREVARELLLEHLRPDQRETFTKNGWFIVEGGRTKTRYRINARGVAGNIDVLDAGDRITHRLCCHARDNGIPPSDHHLSQKIMLELAEDDFLRLANRHAIR